ncbi:hypothetical protein J2W17_001729 [Pseudomonas lini]|uniref:hypothetical protein n=1 Tax=Pseudomonas lini TaxID=163011 RepID=UPI0027879437|nr:hypothetical protein [Pseudomonas lini]MDQ0122784.1 hypothetical protein [Pseudomonas lini]
MNAKAAEMEVNPQKCGARGQCSSCRRLRSFDLDLDLLKIAGKQDQKIAASLRSTATTGRGDAGDNPAGMPG